MRGLKIFFIVSLCLNLAFLAWIGGHHLRDNPTHYRERPALSINDEQRARIKEMRQEHRQLMEILTAENFESDSFLAQADLIAQKRDVALRALHQAVHDKAVVMDKAEREELAQSLRPRHHHKKRN